MEFNIQGVGCTADIKRVGGLAVTPAAGDGALSWMILPVNNNHFINWVHWKVGWVPQDPDRSVTVVGSPQAGQAVEEAGRLSG